jgi:chaperone required for assembly of F1-ATPase
MSEKEESPIRRAQKAARQVRMPRFYKEVGVDPGEGGFALRLDGRAVRTPGKAVLAVPSAELAEAIAGEWQAQGKEIDPATMPLTRLANTVIDRIAGT